MNTALRLLPCLLVALTLALAPAVAEEAPPEDVPLFSQAELDQMLAPVALYPDQLLSQLLMAATYPLEIVQAARWSRANPELKGQEAVRAVDDEPWDPSVKAMVAFPEILDRMDADLDWTGRLGDAFLAQQAQVMDTVQALRQRAEREGNLRSNEYIEVEEQGPTIVVRHVRPEVVYVPYYDPWVVYGHWWWPRYRPVYWDPWPGYYPRYGHSSFYWGSGIHVGFGFFFSSWDWHHHHVRVVERPPFYYHRRPPPRHIWVHDHHHRRGVPYRSVHVHKRYVKDDSHPPRVRHDARPYRGDRDHVRRHAEGRGADLAEGERGARTRNGADVRDPVARNERRRERDANPGDPRTQAAANDGELREPARRGREDGTTRDSRARDADRNEAPANRRARESGGEEPARPGRVPRGNDSPAVQRIAAEPQPGRASERRVRDSDTGRAVPAQREPRAATRESPAARQRTDRARDRGPVQRETQSAQSRQRELAASAARSAPGATMAPAQRSGSREAAPSHGQRSPSREAASSRSQRHESREAAPSHAARSPARETAPSYNQRSAPRYSQPAPTREASAAFAQRSAPREAPNHNQRSAPRYSQPAPSREASAAYAQRSAPREVPQASSRGGYSRQDSGERGGRGEAGRDSGGGRQQRDR